MVGAAALMALLGAASASATTLTCGSGAQCAEHTAIKAESEGKLVIDLSFGNVECNSTFAGTTESSSGTTVPRSSRQRDLDQLRR